MRLFHLILLGYASGAFAQALPQRLEQAIQALHRSEGGASAQISMTLLNTQGELIYEHNGHTGLTTASTQKLFTAAAALETLGKDYRYITTLSHTGSINDRTLNGDLYLTSNGDPTLGSWRYEGYHPEDFKKAFCKALSQMNLRTITGNLVLDDAYFDFQTIPGGWPWNDLGNYYGAGVWGINWRENQFDLRISSGNLIGTNVELPGVQWVSELSLAGQSDNSFIFTAPHSQVAFINGTLPAGKTMSVSGAMPNPPLTLANEIKQWIKELNIHWSGNILIASSEKIKGRSISLPKDPTLILKYQSPPLSDIIHWFLKKSINLYGETLLKTMAKEKMANPSFTTGVIYLKNFWQSKGLPKQGINFADGSGLSPQNYVSSQAQVQALSWAKKQAWFSTFYDSLPTINGMKMKSGTMKNTKSFAGYHNGYIFSIILNNYQGQDSSEALFKILGKLKKG